MQMTASSQYYLIKNKSNQSYFFQMNSDRTIGITFFSEDNYEIGSQVLSPKEMIDFAVTIDSNDLIHLICISQEGELLYFIEQKKRWNHRQIAKLDIKSNQYKNLMIIIKNKDTHVFCNKTNLTNPLVTSIEHMYWNDKQINRKTVCNYLPGKYPSPLLADFDTHGNVHLFYKVLYKNNHQIYYNNFNAYNKKWSNPEMISNLQEDHSHPHMLIDHRDNLHLAWCTIEGGNFVVRYRKKMNVVNLKAKWSATKTLSDANANSLSPLLIQEGQRLKLLYKQTNQLVELSSEDYGSHWTPLEEKKIYPNVQAKLIKYFTNHDFEKITLSMQQCYGEINERITLYGTGIYEDRKPTLENPLMRFQRALNPTSLEMDEPSNVPVHREQEPKPEPAPEPEPEPTVVIGEPSGGEASAPPVVEEEKAVVQEEISMPKGRDTEAPQEIQPLSIKSTEGKEASPPPPVAEAVIPEEKPPTPLAAEPLPLEKSPQPQIILREESHLKALVQEVQNHIQQMLLEVERIEKAQQAPLKEIEEIAEEQEKEPDHLLYQHLLALNKELMEIESQQMALQTELNNYQKRIYEVEDRMISFKKMAMELEDRMTGINSLHPGILSKIKNLFK